MGKRAVPKGFLPNYNRLDTERCSADSGVGASGSSASSTGTHQQACRSLPQEVLQALGLAPQPSLVSPVSQVAAPAACAEEERQLAPKLGTCHPLTPNQVATLTTNVSTASSSSSSSRKDAPAMAYTSGAKRARGSEAFDRELLLESLECDYSANSSKATNDSVWRTWCSFHRKWFHNEDYLPLTPESLKGISSLFKHHAYRSFPNYLGAAKRRHVLAGYPWTDNLDAVARMCTRSVLRGVGPPKQSSPLDLELLASLKLGYEPLVSDGPVNPQECAVLASFFLLREIELSLLKFEHVEVKGQGGGASVVLTLAVSKTDPTAVGVERRWGCLCDTLGAGLCPAHVAAKHVLQLKRHFADPYPAESPLFPTASGTTASKHAVVRTIEMIAQSCHLPLVDNVGRRAFGGHAFRVTGAQFLAARGVSTDKLMLLGRWRSSAVLRYVGEAPLSKLTEDRAARRGGKSASSVSNTIMSHMTIVYTRSDVCLSTTSRACKWPRTGLRHLVRSQARS